jgi:hypothetical protein
VQSVYAQALTRAPARVGRRGAFAVLAALTCVVALAAALPHGHGRPAAPRGPAWLALVGGLPLQQARCAQWLGASASERDRALAALQAVVGGPTPFGRATALTPAEGERLFDRTCANPIARNFLLYELYTRASGFRSLVDPSV